MNFLQMREFIRNEYIQFTWPKVKMENLCASSKGGADIVSLTPTQGFVSSFLTPASAYKGLLLYSSVGTGKCWLKDTPILMYDGSVKMVQDIQVGDVVMGDDSTPRNVLSLGQGDDEMFDIVPRKGETYTVNSEHILVLKYSGKCLITGINTVSYFDKHTLKTKLRSFASKEEAESFMAAMEADENKIVEIEVQDYLNLPPSMAMKLNTFRRGVDFPEQSIDFNPYICGLALNGAIPHSLKINSKNIRLHLLAGILDAKADYLTKTKKFVVSGISEIMTKDVLYVARSLGFAAYMLSEKIMISGNGLHELPTLRFHGRLLKNICSRDPLMSRITVKPRGRDHYYGFTLDGNNRLLMGDFTVTHNTCTAIATASSSFEKEGYTVLWVTRTTLKSDIWKNMFEQVCSADIKDKITSGKLPNMPVEQAARMRLLSKSWNVRPMSYKQFSNLVSGKNAFYEQLVKINGKDDPLRKTFLIIDEAHKLYGGTDLSAVERPDMKKLHKSIMNSYVTSGKDSVKLLLMTATPMTNDPMELIKLINLLRLPHEQLPEKFSDFKDQYLDEFGKFTKKGMRDYLDDIAGLVSYLSRETDARQFAQPTIIPVNVPISRNEFTADDLERLKDDYELAIQSDQLREKDLKSRLLQFRQNVAERKKLVKDSCRGLKGQNRLDCLNRIEGQIANLEEQYNNERSRIETEQMTLKDNKTKMKNDITAKTKLVKEDKSQEGILLNKCLKKSK